MSRWQSGIIHPTARYRTQSSTQGRGIYNLKEQLQHIKAENWPVPFAGWPSNLGQSITATFVLASTSNDDPGPYTVYHNEFDSAAALGTTGRLYMAIKNTATAPRTYYNDFAIGAVQLLSDDYNTLNHGWSFSILADYTDWEYATVTGLNTANPGYENYSDIIGATSQSWAACVNSVSNGRISRASSTGSTFTGPADGLANAYSDGDTGTIITDGTSSIAQTSTTSFMFTESSGTASNIENKWYWIRSPEITLDGDADKDIAIAYNATTHHTVSEKMADAADNQLFRWWWIPS